jgi:hypothetical protein
MQTTLEMFNPKIYPTPTAGAAASHAKLFLALAEGVVSRIHGELLSLKYSGSLPFAAHGYCSSKTLAAYLDTTISAPSASSSPRWLNWGIMSNGNVLTATLMYPKTARESSLADIMEEFPADKYFLSPKSTEKLLRRLSAGRKAAESTAPKERAPRSPQAAADSAPRQDYIWSLPEQTNSEP